MKPSAMAEKTAAKYRGNIARTYDAQREGETKWKAEDAVIREWLAGYPADTGILDCPVGTGRFISLYEEKQFSVTGIDISPDMLSRAHKKAQSDRIALWEGSIFDIERSDKSVDVALSIRIMNLIDANDMKRALKELQRVARKAVIFNLRVWHPATKYRRPQKFETIVEALQPGWKIAENREIHQHDFRMFRLEVG